MLEQRRSPGAGLADIAGGQAPETPDIRPSMTESVSARRPPTFRWLRSGLAQRRLLMALSVMVGIGVWQLLGIATSHFAFATFSATIASFWHLLENGVLPRATLISIKELAIGFTVGGLAGLVGGGVAGLYRTFRTLTDLWITTFLAIPFAAIFPIFLVWFGLGSLSKIALAIFASLLTIWVQTYAGVLSVDHELKDVPRAFGGSAAKVVWWIVLPWSIPFVLEGLRLGLTRAFLAVIVGEMLAGQGGLGYLIELSGNSLNMASLLAGVLMIVIISILLVSAMRTVQRLTVPWGADQRAGVK